MNILFFLSPKQDLMYVYDDFTLRQTLEKWENNRYASIPVLNRKDRKSTRLNSSHNNQSRMPSSA